jgi:uncharacterized protein (DUF1501 family)
MHNSRIQDLSRRAFLRRSSQLAMTGTALPFAMNLAAIGEAAAFTGTDYKALVCIFLYGGNDYANTLIPYDSPNYDLYSLIRGGGAGQTAGGIAVARSSLAGTILTPSNGQVLTDNIQYALSPSMPLMKQRFDENKLALQLNVGPLLAPTTLAQYKSSDRIANPLPPQLFSHNDQQSTWQSSGPEGAATGWGGRMGDLAQSSNSNAVFTAISATGNAVFLAGEQAIAYQVGTSGSVPVYSLKYGISNAPKTTTDALRTLVTQTSSHIFEGEYAKVANRAIDSEAVLSAGLAPVKLTTSFKPATGSNSLASQLEIVAKIIAARTALGTKRQVFFVSLGGFDNHDGLNAAHPGLLSKLDFAMDAFYRATLELGVSDKVTTFTASDFGRTLSSNGDGSDHGWGGHHFVLGGAVNGRQFYGTAPSVSVTSNDQVGQGRLLPSTSVDQYGSTLATWFGVSPSELPSVFPNIGRFGNSNLGFV